MADPVSLAITVALNAATMAMTMMNKVEGPRLDDLSVSTADYGTPLVQFHGTVRLELPCMYAETIREEKDKQKGKGGKYVEYKYFGTWASFVADHQISAVVMLWLDRHLVIDTTKTAGPVLKFVPGPAGIEMKLQWSDKFRIYYGTETQQPDPRMLATIEANEGAGMCPAYLGMAYLMFEDLPLEKFGNRLPQVSGVFSRPDPTHLFPTLSVARTDARLNTEPRFSPDRRKLIAASGGLVDYWVLPLLTRISSQQPVTGASPPFGVTNDGSFYAVELNGISGGNVYHCSAFGASTQLVNGRTDAAHTHTFYAGCEWVNNELCIYPAGLIQATMGSLESDGLGLYIHGTDPGFIPTHYFATRTGPPMAVGKGPLGTEPSVYFVEAPAGTASWAVNVGGFPGNCSAMENADGNYVVYSPALNKLFLIDSSAHTLLASINAPSGFPSAMHRTVMAGALPGTSFLWFQDTEINTRDLTIKRTIDFTDWTTAGQSFQLYDVNNHALIGEDFLFGSDNWVWRFLDRQAPTGTLLGDICADVALQCGMLPDEFDFSDLDQAVPGYAWTQGPGKEIVGPLLELYDSDIGPHEWIQRGLKRGRALGGPPITSEWMVPESGEDGGPKPLWKIPMAAETDLPLQVFATFSDPTMEYQPNTDLAQRSAAAVDTKRVVTFDLGTLAIDPEDIHPLLERALRRYWIAAVKPECRVTPLEIKIEPGDVRHFFFGDEVRRCKVVGTNIRANRVIDLLLEVDGETPAVVVDWQSDQFSPLHATFPAPGAYTGGRPPDELFNPVPTKGFLIDVALLRDTDDQTVPFMNTAAGKDYSGTWIGATVWVADSYDAVTSDGTEFAAGWDNFTSDQACIYGYTVTALPPAIPFVIDNASQIEVFMPNDDALSSITEAQMLASQTANLAVIGNEVVQFTTATPIAPRRYRLSGFIRGARGTEHAIRGHVANERFVLVDSDVKKRDMGAEEIGDTDYYKFATLGFDPTLSEVIALQFQANAHRPLAPVNLVLSHNSSSNDWSASWTRRSRIGGGAINGQDVPLGETSEAYRVKIYDPANIDTTNPVRIINVTSPSFTYTAAQQQADFGVVLDRLVFDVMQMSPALSLEGFPARGDKVVGAPQLVGWGAQAASNNVGTTTVPYPTEGTRAGDIAILQVMQNTSPGVTITPPVGFQQIGSPVDPGNGFIQTAFWKRCDGYELDDEDVVMSSSSGDLRGRISLWRGAVLSGNPVEGAGGNFGADTTAESAAVTTLGPSRTVVNLLSVLGDATFTPPSGYTEGYDENDTTGSNGSLSINSIEVAAASTVGPATTTVTPSANWDQHSFALIPSEP